MRITDFTMAPRFRSKWLAFRRDTQAALDAAFAYAIGNPGRVLSYRRRRHMTRVGTVHTHRITVGYATFVFLDIPGHVPVIFDASLDDGLPTVAGPRC